MALESVLGLVIGYALSRVRHANSQRILLLFEYIARGLLLMGDRRGLFLMTLQWATDRTEVEIGWPRSGRNCPTVVAR